MEVWSKLQIFHVYKFDYSVRVMLGGFSSTKRILWGGLPMLATGHHYNSDQMKLSQASWFTKRKGLPSGKHSWLERGSSGRRSRLQHLPYISPSHPQEFAPSCRRTRWGNLRLAGQSPFRRLSAQTRQSRFLSFRWPSKVSSSAIAQIYGMDCAPKIHVWTTCIEFSIILSIYPQVICHTIIYIYINHTNHWITITSITVQDKLSISLMTPSGGIWSDAWRG